MKKKILMVLAATLIACMLFGGGVYVGAASYGAGSQNDPVVSLSYLEYRLEQLGSAGNTGNTGNTGETGMAASSKLATGYKKTELSRGERFMPGEGGIIVLYSGKCTVVGNVIDLSSAKALGESGSVPAYSQILVPDNASGVVASEKTVLFVIPGE